MYTILRNYIKYLIEKLTNENIKYNNSDLKLRYISSSKHEK